MQFFWGLGAAIGLWMAVAGAIWAQTPVPGGEDISGLLNGGTTNLSLQGDVTWNSALNRGNQWNIAIEGNNNTIAVTPGIFMLEDYRNSATITIRNANITPTRAVTSGGNYLIGLGDGNYNTTLNLEGTTFSGFFSDRYKGGGIIYPYGNGHQVTINGGDAGVTFYGNRGQNDSSGALPVFYSTLTVNGKATFDSNWTGNYGGAMSVYEAANNVTFTGETLFTNNHSVVFGGAVDIWGGNGSRVSFNGPTTFDGNYVYHEAGTNANSPPPRH